VHRSVVPTLRKEREGWGTLCCVDAVAEGWATRLTFWDDIDAIKRFAGDDFSMAKYYDFDSDYLIEKETGVRHYEVSLQASPAPLRNE
jgi:hypothetical protein